MERALAAQKARERYLAQVKANCAEEVRRSKRVAEEQREKRAAEHLKMREELEERHAEAEKRKILLQQSQKRGRATTLNPIEDAAAEKHYRFFVWKSQTPAQAAPIIQRAWRKHRWVHTVKTFTQLDLNVDRVRTIDFEEATELISREDVISCTKRILGLLDLMTVGVDTAQDAAVKTFLSSFLILGHPSHVLSEEDEQAQDVTRKAQDLLTAFDSLLSCRFSDLGAADGPLSAFNENYTNFQSAFAAWRSYDSSFMISGMVAQFVELDGIWQSVKNDQDGAVAEDYKEGVQHNQTLVLARLKKMVGQQKAMQMIRDAIKASRKMRAKKKQQERIDDRPRQALRSSDVSTTPQLHSEEKPLEANPTAFARSQLETSSLVPHNRIVTHEIAINKEWKIDTDAKASTREETISSISDHLHRGLDQGLGDVWIPAIAETIRDKLLSLLKPGNSMHNLISEALDPSLVATQVKHGSFSYEKFFSFMNTILPQLCAPVRDPEVKALATDPSEDPVQQLARLYYIIDIIQLDMLNFQLQQYAPLLLKESSGYEARCFDKEMGGRFPDRTLDWWKNAASSLDEELSRRSDGSSTSPKRITASKIYMQGLTDLSIGISLLETSDIPETLSLDHARLNRIHADILRIITISCILLTAKNLLRRDVRSLWKAEAQRMWELPFTSAPSAFISIVESRYALPASTKQQLSSTVSRVLADAKEAQTSHAVMKLLLKKIKAHVLSRLSASSAEERIRASTGATEVLGSSGMPEFVARIGDIVTELGKVADVDRESHGEWYEKIAEKVTAASEESDKVELSH